MKEELGGEEGFQMISAAVAKQVAASRPPAKKFPYSVLCKATDDLPSEVDVTSKEVRIDK